MKLFKVLPFLLMLFAVMVVAKPASAQGVGSFVVSDTPASATAGIPFSFAVTAYNGPNGTGGIDTGYVGTVTFTSSDPLATTGKGLPANYTFTVADNGVANFGATLKTAGNQTIAAADTVSGVAGTSSAITVNGGAVTALKIVTPTVATAGTAINATVTAYDEYGNVANTDTDAVAISSSDGNATVPGSSALTNGSKAFSVTLKTSGNQTITATDTIAPSITVTSAAIAVAAGAVSKLVVTAPGSASAGTAANLTVTAEDTYGNVATSYTGPVTFTSTDSAAVLPAQSNLVLGVLTFPVTFKTPGSRTVTVADLSGNPNGTSPSVEVVAGAAAKFVVTTTAVNPQTPGTAFSVTVTAEDALGNTVTAYAGTVHFTSTDAAAVLPANATLTNGTGTFNVTLNSGGPQTVTATDTGSGITGLANVTMNAASFLVVPSTTTATAGTSFTVTVTAKDGPNGTGDTDTGYAGTVAITTNNGQHVLPPNAMLAAGVGTFNITLETATNWLATATITATDTSVGTINGVTNPDITVYPGPLASFTVSAPLTTWTGTPITLTVEAFDFYGNPKVGLPDEPGVYTDTVTCTASTDGLAVFPQPQILSMVEGPATVEGEGLIQPIIPYTSGTGGVTYETGGGYTANEVYQTVTVTGDDVPQTSNLTKVVNPGSFVVSELTDTLPAVSDPATAPITLREAINYANTVTNSVITFAGGLTGAITLSIGNGTKKTPGCSNLPAIALSTSIQGPGQGSLTISGSNDSGQADGSIPFTIDDPSGQVTIAGLTVADGFNGGSGGGIYVEAGTLNLGGTGATGPCTVQNCYAVNDGGGIYVAAGATANVVGLSTTPTNTTAITGNSTGPNTGADGAYGAGICDLGTLNLTNSVVSGNFTGTLGLGGGVYVGPNNTAAITNSTIAGNTADLNGGAVCDRDGSTVTIVGSTLSSNTATSGYGGGIYNNVDLSAANCTIYGNKSNQYGGGFYNTYGTPTLTNCTFADNVAGDSGGLGYGGGLFIAAQNAVLTNCIFYGDTQYEINYPTASGIGTAAATDCDIEIAAGNTLATYGVTDEGGNINADPMLGSLQLNLMSPVNTGTTDTMLLVSTSPCIGAGTASGAPATDQRGVTRPDPPSIGSVDSPTVPIPVFSPAGGTAPAPASVPIGQAITITDSASGASIYYTTDGTTPATTVTGTTQKYTAPITVLTGETINAIAVAAGYTINNGQSLVATAVYTIIPNLVVTAPSSATAGAAFSVTVEAEDGLGNPVTTYTDTVHFTSTDGIATMPADYTFTGSGGDAGTHTFTAPANGVTLKTAGSQTVSATDTTTTITGISGAIAVTGGAATSFNVSAPSASTTGTPFSITVTALDMYGNIATTYDGTVFFTSTDPTAVLPANYAFEAGISGDNGVHTFTNGVQLNSLGSETVTATDTTALPAITGTAAVTVSGPPLVVTNINDSGTGSLRAAITTANSQTRSTITFQAGLTGTIALKSGLTITQSMTITGPGASSIAVSGAGSYLPITIDNPGIQVAITGLTIEDGYDAAGTGGGIYVQNGTLNLGGATSTTSCTVTGNTATGVNGFGGGIYNNDTLNLTNCTVTGNSATGATSGLGGGIYNGAGTTTVSSSTLSGNTASVSGGGIYVQGGTLNITGSTLTANTATNAKGGAVYNNATTSITNCTLTGNQANTYGGGVYNSAGAATLLNSTFTANTATSGAAVYLDGGSAAATNCILYADNGSEAFGALTATYSDIEGAAVYAGAGNINLNPVLGSLALNTTNPVNTGTTETISLGATSPCYGAGTSAGAPTTDQRGATRPANPSMGAYDQFIVPVPTISLAPGQVKIGTTFTITDPNAPVGYSIYFTDYNTIAPAKYSGSPIAIPTNETVTAYAVAPGYTTSSTVTAVYTIYPNLVIATPSAATAGSPFTATVTAVDGLNIPVLSFNDPVTITSTDPTVSSSVTQAWGGNGYEYISVTLDTAGNQTITATDATTPTIAGTSGTITVSPSPVAAKFKVVAPSGATAGTAFNVTVTALDAFGNTETGYSGTVTFTSTDGAAVLPPNTTLTNGVGTFSVTLKAPGNQTVTATDTATSSINGTSGSVAVTPGPAAILKVTVSAISPLTAGTPFTATVTAYDSFNNIATSYAGTVQFTSSDPKALLPADSILTNGVGTFTGVILKTAASSQTITATDTVTSTITGTSPPVAVVAASAASFSLSAPASVTVGTPFTLSVTALDAYGNTASGYAGTVAFTSTDPSVSPGSGLPVNSTLTNGGGSFSVTLATAGNQTIAATDTVTSAITGTSGTIVVAAASLIVTNTNDSGSGSLRAAITAANLFTHAAITFTPSLTGTITLKSGLTITRSMTITGPGATSIYINGAGDYLPFTIDNTGIQVAISGLTIQNGNNPVGTGGLGGGIYVEAGSLGLTSCTLSSNIAGTNGGGIYNADTLTLTDCTLSGNSTTNGSGGGLYNTVGTTTIVGTTLTDNSTNSGGSGGGVYNNSGTTTVGTSTLSNNTAGTSGGAICVEAGSVPLTNSTLAGNTAASDEGGGIYVNAGAASTLLNCTLTNNAANKYSGGIYNNAGSVTAENSIIFGDTGGDVSGALTATYSDIGTTPVYAGVGNINSDPLLDPSGLQDNPTLLVPSPPTQTIALLDASPCYRAGLATALTTDQRGVLRPTPPSIGAYDQFIVPVPTISPVSGTVAIGTQLTFADSLGGVSFYYTTDATTPTFPITGTTTKYAGPLTIQTNETVQVIGVETGYANSGVATAAYTIIPKLAVTAASPQTAGTPFTTTVTAEDGNNATDLLYNGTVSFTSSDGAAVLPASLTLVDGVATCSVTLITSGSQTITATDTVVPAITGTSAAITVDAASAVELTVDAPGSAAAGTPISVTVTALDAYGNIATGYAGTAHFTSTDGAASLPADSTLTDGVGTFSVTLKTPGSQTVTATDTVTSSIAGTSGTITVSPGPAVSFNVTTTAGSPQAAGTAFNVTVTALDVVGNVASGYAGTVHFTSTDGIAVLPANATLTDGVGTFSATLKTSGSQTITATDTVAPGITGVSPSITVSPGAAVSLTVSAPGSATAGSAISVTVTALDTYGNTATGYAGTVHFTSTDAAAVLPANATLTSGTGSFSVTLDTSGNQTVTATDTVSPSITGTSGTISAAAAAATTLVVSAPNTATAGAPIDVTVTAEDTYGNTATGYAGIVGFTSTDGAAVLPANSTLTNGVMTFSVTMKTAGSQTITATDTVATSITGTSGTITVNPGSPITFTITTTASSPQAAGTAFNVTVTAKDTNGNVATGYAGIVHFTSTDGIAVLPANATLTDGVGTFSATLKTSGSQTITATDTVAPGITGVSPSITVSPGAAVSLTVSAPGSATAGSAISVTVTALDTYGNTATGYAGTVHFTSTDAAAVLPANATLTSGTGSFSVTLDTSGNQTVTATDTVSPSITGTSGTISATAAAATTLVVSAPNTATAGAPIDVTVTAEDTYGNTATGYAGIVGFTSTDGAAVLPANSTLTNGVMTFSVTMKTAGSQTITATDTVATSITGTSGTITVNTGTAVSFKITTTAGSPQLAGAAFNVTVTAKDAVGNTVTGYGGSVTFTSSDGSALLPADSTLTDGVGTFSVTLKTSGSQTVTATDTVTDSITGTSAAITVMAAQATRLVISAPSTITAGSVLGITVTALDNFGNVATGYAGTVQFSTTDNKAVPPANSALTNGTKTFSMMLSTAGAQTVSAQDTVNSSINGVSGPIIVTPGAVASLTVSAPASTAVSSAFSITVRALDANGNIATSYGGTVTFTSSDGAALLPANSTLTNGVGSFSATLKTIGSQRITATDVAEPALTGTTAAIDVTAASSVSFVVSAPSSAAAGSSFSVTVTAKDAFGNTATGYTGTVDFSSSDSGATLPPNSTLTNGSGTFTVALKTLGSQTVTAKDQATPSITGTSGTIIVVPGAAVSLAVSGPSSTPAGSPLYITVTAKDAGGNTATGYAGTVEFRSTDASSALPAYSTLVNGTGTFVVTLKTLGKQTITASDLETPSITGTTGAITVTPGAAVSLVVSAPATESAGSAININVTAKDMFGNTATGYAGIVHFTSTAASATLPANGTLTNGVGTFSVTLKTSGSQTIAVTDTVTPSIAGQSGSINVVPGSAATLVISAPGTEAVGSAFNITVTAKDSLGNTATGYTGSVHFTSTDSAAVLPVNAPLTGGAATFSVTLKTLGNQTVTATDSAKPSLTGTSGPIAVVPGTAVSLVVSGPASASAGSAFDLLVTAKDALGNTVTAYNGTVHFTSTDISAVLPANTTLTNGVGAFNVTLKVAGSQTVTATDTITSSIAGTSATIDVAPGPAEYLTAYAAATVTYASPFNLTVTALDAYGNVATGYAGTVHFASTDDSAVLPADSPLANGAGTFTVTLNTVGTQTIAVTDTASSIAGTSGAILVQLTFGTGLSFFSSPYDYSNEPIADILGYDNPVLAVWSAFAGTYALSPNPPANEIHPGVGYWARFPQQVTLPDNGTLLTAPNIDLQLLPGWTPIGDPFATKLPVSSLLFNNGTESLATAASAGLVEPYVFGYNQSTNQYEIETSLTPGMGYWIFASSLTDVLIPQP